MKFDMNPWRYIPAFGGHCTYGIAAKLLDSTQKENLVLGKIAFECVNTTNWVVNKGMTYMNSCAHYYLFVKNQTAYMEEAKQIWTQWWGHARAGPINDGCFQDGGLWDFVDFGALIPPFCAVNAPQPTDVFTV